jgi:GWxTD domain-containing protein
LFLVVALAALPWAPTPAGAGPKVVRPLEGPGALPWRVSGPAGFTVDAASFPDSTGLAVELFLHIPPSTLRRVLADSAQAGRLRIQAELRSGYGGHRQDQEQFVDVSPRDTLGEYGEVVVLRFPARPGPQQAHVRVQDLRRPVTKLPRFGGGKLAGAEVSGDFELPAPQSGRQMSAPEFVWAEQGETPGPFQRLSRTLIPNPDRLYGLFSPDLYVAFIVAGPDTTRPWHWRVRALDERQSVVASAESTVAAAARIEAQARMDVSRLPAGGYDLELSAWQEGDPKPLQRMARFSIAWQPETWRRSTGELQDLVHLLFEGDDEERFSRLQPGEQERWMEDFWRRRDPTPETAVNEARQAFLGRVTLANLHYGRAGLEPGMFSDMGRVFIRYGEPSEIQKQVLPAGDETLRQVIQELSFTENREVGGINPQGLGGDMRPYEIWIYEGEIPAPIEADPGVSRAARHQRLLFLFVDEHGLGDFRLRYSNE